MGQARLPVSSIRGYLTLLAFALLAGDAASSQTSQPASKPADTIPFVDRTYGYELRIPAGWKYDRTGYPGPEGSVGLLRGASPDGRSSLQVLLFRDFTRAPFDEWIDYFARRIGGVSGTQRVEVTGNEAAARPEAVVTAMARIGADDTCTFYYCVQFDPTTVWVFAYACALGADPLKERIAARGRFERIIGSLLVLYSPEQAARLREALVNGIEFRSAQIQRYAGRINPDQTEHYYRIVEDGRPIGFMTRQFLLEQRSLDARGNAARDGVRVRESAWRFGEDGSVRYSRYDLFSSQDLASDLIEITRTSLPPAADDKTPIVTSVDQCVREGDVIFSTHRTSLDVTLPDPRRPIQLDESYLGLAWVRLLPGLLGTSAGAARGFVVYDPHTRALIPHIIEPLGPKPLPGQPDQTAYAFETREGFSQSPATVYTDERGTLLRLESGSMVVTRCTQAEIEREFGAKRDAARERIREQQEAATPRTRR